MAALPSNLRRDLERAIIDAREIAVAGSRSALEALTVHEGKRGSHVTDEKQVALRNHLRAHAKQIGDRRNSQSGAQAIDRLVQECAYEHWHRMIFARFLAENNLLVEPDSQVTVTLEDVEELAREERIDRWELAGRFAQKSLPAIFRADDPLLQVRLPRETRLQLDELLNSLPPETFLADDSLGWVYQFWQSAEKDRVNEAGEKITGETLAAVTQLFTEHYMVLFLLHNTLGAWHAGKVLAERMELARKAASETALRNALRLTEAGGYDFEYLRFVRVNEAGEPAGDAEQQNHWRPMGGTFDGWPRRAAELKVLDPCCGSGHFLVAAFELLVRLRMREDGLSVMDAVDAVIRDNLFGLEIDPRCTQIAAFNVAVSAWKLTGPRALPPMSNIACTGLSVGVPRETWMQALEEGGPTNLRFYFGQLYDMFKSASTLGSLINPNRFLGSHMLMKAEIDRLLQLLEAVIAKDPSTAPEQHELGVASQGLARAAQLLADRYHVVLTNVPYLGRGKQDRTLKEHLETYYDRGKADLAAAFVLRCLEFCNNQGTATFVSPQNWWFLSSYSSLRESLLIQYSLLFCATLGEEAWQSFGDRGPVATLSARLPDGRRLELADIYVLLNTTHPRHGEVFEALEASLPQDVLLDFRRLHSMGRARDQDAYTESTDNRLRRFLSPITGAMCSGSAPGIDFGEIIRRRHVLLVNLKSTFISREVANTVGGLVINEIVNAMMRADEEKGIRTPHHLVIDEASEFLGEDFGYILTKARKWGLSLVLSAQSRSSFRRGEVDVWENVTNCCKTVVSFQQKNVPDVRELGEFFAFPNRVLYEMYRVMDRPAPELDEIIETVDRGRAQTSGVSNTSTRSDNVGVSRGEAEGESESESYSVTDSEGKGTSKSNTWSRGWGGGSSSSRGRGKSDATHSHPVLRDGRLQMLRSEGDTVNVSASSSDFSSTHEGEGGSEGLHFSENRAVSRGGSTSTYASTDRRVSHNVTRGEATSESHSETASETVRQNLVQRTREEWHPTGNARYAIPYQNAIHEFLLTTLGDQFAFVRTKINNIEQTCLFRVADVHPPFRDATEAREKTRAFRERLLRSKPYMIFDPQLPEASESKRLDALVRPPETQPKITPGKGRPSSGPFSLE